jgi:hypothetical protein
MKLKFLAALGAVSLALGAGTALARSGGSGSPIEINGTVGATVQDMQVYGQVRSPRATCVPNRTVKVFSEEPSGLKLIDKDRTSRRGYFFGGGDFGDQVNGVRVKVAEQTVGGHVCKSDIDSMRIL